MKRSILIVLICFLLKSASCQYWASNDLKSPRKYSSFSKDKISFTIESGWDIDYEKLNFMIGNELNELRRSVNLNGLTESSKCEELSVEQSEYMIRTGNFSHGREHMDFTTRVRSIVGKGHFGENLLHEPTSYPIELYVKNYDNLKGAYTESDIMWECDRVTYTLFAKKIIKKWIDSPPHYRNLVNPLWNYFSVSVVSNKKGVYVTLIFEE
jgi:uncharacterized protein YkwD